MNILLVGNYEKDQQESMQRYPAMLQQQLSSRGVEARILRPPIHFGRFGQAHSGYGKWMGYLDKYVVFPRLLRREASKGGIVHICDHSNAVYVPHVAPQPHLVTCHDLLAIRSALGEVPENPTSRTGQQLQHWIRRGLERSRHICCVSESTRRDVLRLCRVPPHLVEVIFNGLNYPFSPMAAKEVESVLRPLLGEHPLLGWPKATQRLPSYLLHVGGNQWYKNRLGLLRIYARLSQGWKAVPPLVMAGHPLTPPMIQLIQKEQLRVIPVTQVSNEALRALYCGAAAFIFPSLQEGFGWPVAEAQACGCPVITTSREPMTDVGGAAADYFNPDQVEEASRRVRSLLEESPEARQARMESGWRNVERFSTTHMMDLYLDLYRRIQDAAPR